MIRIPNKAEIPDRVCIVKGSNWDYAKTQAMVSFSSKVNDPPFHTLDIIPNIINGILTITPVSLNSSNIYSTCDITHCLHFSNIDKRVYAQINHWAINDLLFSGLVEKGGKLKFGTELVAVVYGSHSTLVLKGGEIYNEIMK